MVAAATIGEDLRISFWDAMIVRRAVAMGCTRLWTEDLNDGQRLAGVQVTNPFAAG